jgi:predicted PurR-regulated permease PerM
VLACGPVDSAASSVPAPARRRSRLTDIGFFAVLLICGFLFWRTIQSVVIPVVIGAFIAVLVSPWCDRLTDKLKGRRRLASAITTVAVTFIVVVPTFFLGWVVADELAGGAEKVASSLQREGLAGALHDMPVVRRLHLEAADLKRLADTIVGASASILGDIVEIASEFFIGTFLLFVSLYYFLKEGRRWVVELERVAPIDEHYVRAFAREFVRVSHGLFYGTVVNAVVQGTLAGIGYAIFGVPQAVLWGAVTALMSLTPVVGTTVVWAPLALFMAMTGSTAQGIGVLVWGAVAVGGIDNFIRPWLMKGRMRIHPLLVFLSVIGGVAAFGVVGILIGPLAASLFWAALRIYDRDFRRRLEAPAIISSNSAAISSSGV